MKHRSCSSLFPPSLQERKKRIGPLSISFGGTKKKKNSLLLNSSFKGWGKSSASLCTDQSRSLLTTCLGDKAQESVLGDREQTFNHLWLKVSRKECEGKRLKETNDVTARENKSKSMFKLEWQSLAPTFVINASYAHQGVRGPAEVMEKLMGERGRWRQIQGSLGCRGSCKKLPGMLRHVLNRFCCQTAPLVGLASLGAVKF